MMKFSLLFSDICNAEFGDIENKTIYNLSLDRSFKTICSSQEEYHYFLETLSKPLVQKKDILFRHEIISDLLRNPLLFDALNASLTEFEMLKKEFKTLKKEILDRNFGIRSALGGTKVSVRESSQLLKKFLIYLKDLDSLLSRYPISSEGLCTISRYTSAFVKKDTMDKLISLLEQTENLCIQSNIDTVIKLDENGKISNCHLMDPKILNDIIVPERKKFTLRKNHIESTPYVQLSPPMYSDSQNTIRAYPYLEMETLLTSMIGALVDRFGDLNKEIRFYSVIVKYVRLLEQNNIPFTLPSIGESTHFVGMTDLFLLMTKVETDIVTNDFYIYDDKKGSIVLGDNGNGKTVFLRSIAVCQILAQAGMPIPAQSGTIAAFKTIKTQFSESEEITLSTEKMGRFEQEVKELCALIDQSKSGSFLFLNEIFQTTAYSEGAIGLYHILNYLSAKNIGWVLVTHLTDLKQYFENQNVSIYHITKEHKVAQIQ